MALFQWRNIEVVKRQKAPKSDLNILKGVSGEAVPGEVLAIMGPSGSGKTTLLNVLHSGKHPQCETKGSVDVNGKDAHKHYKDRMGYVHQADALLGIFTPRELLNFVAELKLPQTYTAEQKRARVDEVLRQLKLEKVADNKVGDQQIRGLSGGERRRVSIAMELTPKPQILICDEITSGLDSHVAQSVCDTVTKLAEESNITVVMTIHQPSSKMMRSNFSKLLMMVDGDVIFHRKTSEAVSWFERVLTPLTIPPNTNPGEWLIEVATSTEFAEEQAHEGGRAFIEKLQKAWAEEKANIQLKDAEKDSVGEEMTHWKPATIAKQCLLVTKREWKNQTADPYYFVTQLVTNLFVAVFIGTMYWQKTEPTLIDLTNRLNAEYFGLINICFVPMMSAIVRFPNQREVFNREREAGLYGPFAFSVALLVDVPMQVIQCFAFSVYYPMVGLNPDVDAYLMHVFILIMAMQVFSGLGFLCCAIAPTTTGAINVAMVPLLIFMSFGGLFIDYNSIPAGYKWAAEISPFRYTWNTMAMVEVQRTDMDDTIANLYRDEQGLDDDTGRDFLVLAIQAVILRIMTYCVLRYTKGVYVM